MALTLEDSAQVFYQALPYADEFRGHTFVIACGDLRPATQKAFCRDVSLLRAVGVTPVVVRPARNGDARKAREFVRDFGDFGRAVGLSGAHGGLVVAEQDGSVAVDIHMVNVLKADYICVLEALGTRRSTPGVEAAAETMQVDHHEVAAAVAVALNAYKLIFVAGEEVVGLRPAGDGSARTVSEMRATTDVLELVTGPAEVHNAVHAVRDALDQGVSFGHVIPDQRHTILAELFSERGIGTKLWPAGTWESGGRCPAGYNLWPKQEIEDFEL